MYDGVEVRRRLTEFYIVVNPQKLDTVDAILVSR
jgi:hypothetical protein